MCVHIIDLHTPSDSLPHLQYCNFIIRMLFYQAYWHGFVCLWLCTVSQKVATLTMAITLSIIRDWFVKFFHSCEGHYISNNNVSMLLHYLGKFNIKNLALFVHVKHVSNVTFYHVSNRYPSKVMKISAKIHTMQNINIVFFCSFTVLTSLKLCS